MNKLFKYGSLALVAIGLLYSCSNHSTELPYLGPEGSAQGDSGSHYVIPPFQYLNQDSIPVTEKDFQGKIYVADFFFTSCNTICPIMHRNMLKVYEKYKGNPKVKILSHSIDIKYDLPSRLKTYASKLGVNDTQWEFVHGSRDSIYNIAAKSYLVAAYENKQDPQGLVHQGWFILIDQNRHLRGAYDGTQADQVEKLLSDMDILLAEDEN